MRVGLLPKEKRIIVETSIKIMGCSLLVEIPESYTEEELSEAVLTTELVFREHVKDQFHSKGDLIPGVDFANYG